jgi:hypothetical protein
MWTSNVDSTVQSTMGPFYSDVASSGYLGWLSEYGAGRGSLLGTFTIAPTTELETLSDVDIAQELG